MSRLEADLVPRVQTRVLQVQLSGHLEDTPGAEICAGVAQALFAAEPVVGGARRQSKAALVVPTLLIGTVEERNAAIRLGSTTWR